MQTCLFRLAEIGVVLVMMLSVLSCQDSVLEKKDIFHFVVKKVSKDGSDYVVVSGLCGHSAYGVKDYRLSQNEDVLDLFIDVVSVGDADGLSGRFEYEIKLDDSVNVVRLGKQKNIIWKRE